MFVFVDDSIVLSNLSLPITMILLKNICFLLLGLLKKSLLWNWSEILTQIYFVYRWRPFWNTVSNIFVWNKLNKSIFLFIRNYSTKICKIRGFFEKLNNLKRFPEVNLWQSFPLNIHDFMWNINPFDNITQLITRQWAETLSCRCS